MSHKAYTDGQAYCQAVEREVTLRCDPHGLVICREWKSCTKVSDDNCAAKIMRELMVKEVRKQREQVNVGEIIVSNLLRDLR